MALKRTLAKGKEVMFSTIVYLSLCLTTILLSKLWRKAAEKYKPLECGPMPNVMVALPNIGGAQTNETISAASGPKFTIL